MTPLGTPEEDDMVDGNYDEPDGADPRRQRASLSISLSLSLSLSLSFECTSLGETKRKAQSLGCASEEHFN